MSVTQLSVHRRDKAGQALIKFTGEIDLYTVPQVRASMESCLRDGIHTVDVDLTGVTFCDCSGLGAFLKAAWQFNAVGGSFRLHQPSALLTRMIDVTGVGFLLKGLPVLSPPPGQLSPAVEEREVPFGGL